MSPTVHDELRRLIESAGMADFIPTAQSYRPRPIRGTEDKIVPISSIMPFTRKPTILPFKDERALQILDGFRFNKLIPSIEVFPRSCDMHSQFEYELYDGFHRFHLSKAVGFSHIPVHVISRLMIRLDG